MKLAITGKGGVGKTTVAAGLARALGARGLSVTAVDADPDANLAAALGLPKEVRRGIVPLSRMNDLIDTAKVTGGTVKIMGQDIHPPDSIALRDAELGANRRPCRQCR